MVFYIESIIPDWDLLNPDSDEYDKQKNIGLDYARLELSLTMLKSETLSYIQKSNIEIGDRFDELDDWVFQSIGKYCWMLNNGAIFNDETTTFINQKFEELRVGIQQLPIADTKQKIIPTEPGIILFSEFEDLIIEKQVDDGSLIYEQLNKTMPSPKSISVLIQHLNDLVSFLSSLDDDEKNEAYGNNYNETVKEVKLILRITKAYKKNSKITRKTQREKTNGSGGNYRIAKTVEEIKYKKQDLDLHLVSIDPKTIVGSQALLMYNAKNRKLSLLYSSNGDGFEIRGTTIHNIDEKKSFQKTLRKPQQQLESLRDATQHRAEIVLGEYIKGKAANVVGRTNSDIIFIKAW